MSLDDLFGCLTVGWPGVFDKPKRPKPPTVPTPPKPCAPKRSSKGPMTTFQSHPKGFQDETKEQDLHQEVLETSEKSGDLLAFFDNLVIFIDFPLFYFRSWSLFDYFWVSFRLFSSLLLLLWEFLGVSRRSTGDLQSEFWELSESLKPKPFQKRTERAVNWENSSFSQGGEKRQEVNDYNDWKTTHPVGWFLAGEKKSPKAFGCLEALAFLFRATNTFSKSRSWKRGLA